jgi:hypothetical protein
MHSFGVTQNAGIAFGVTQNAGIAFGVGSSFK